MHLLTVITFCGLLFYVQSQVDLEACGEGRFKDIQLDSGSVSMSYDDIDIDATCQWHVYPTTEIPQKVAVITVESLQFEDTHCKETHLKLFDNVNSSDSDSLMNIRCDPVTGRQSYTRISKSPSFTIEYLDVGGGRHGNLVVHFEFIEPTSDTIACGFDGPARIASGERQVTSPAPDAGFPLNNIACRWIFEGNADEYVLVELESGAEFRTEDYVTCHDGKSNASTVLATWNNHNQSLTSVHNGGPYMYIEMSLGQEEEGIQPFMTFNIETIKTYDWACTLTTSDQQPPALLTQVNDIVLSHPDYNVTKALDLMCHWSIAPGAGWYVAASVKDFTLGSDTTEPCTAETSPLLTLRADSESFFCGSEENVFLNYSFPTIDVILDAPASTRLESDYFMINTSGSNIAEMACSETAVLTNQPGIIVNADYPDATAANKNCVWIITAPIDLSVRLDILEYTSNCADTKCGFTIDEWAFVYYDVGPHNPAVFYSSTHSMKIEYTCHTCSQTSETTFRFNYTFFVVAEVCDNPIVLTAEEGVISSPGYGEGTYPRRYDCKWMIDVPNPQGKNKSIVLDFMDLDLRDEDYIEVHDGLFKNATKINKYVGKLALPPKTATNQTTAFILFNARYGRKGEARGFTLHYHVSDVPYTELACDKKSRPTTVYNEHANILSPDYPVSYVDIKHCTWKIDIEPTELIEFEFMDMDFAFSSCLDIVAEGTNGYTNSIVKYCMNDVANGTKVRVAAAHAYVNYTSKSFYFERGFNMTQKILKRQDIACQLNGEPIGLAMSVSDKIETPDLNPLKGDQMICRWFFNASIEEVVEMSFRYNSYYAHGDCYAGYYKILDRVGGKEIVREYSCGSSNYHSLMIGPIGGTVETYGNIQYDGLAPAIEGSITYTNVTEEACSGNRKYYVKTSPGYLVSPNYGIGFYPPLEALPHMCKWSIHAQDDQIIHFYFEDFDVGFSASKCLNEYLNISEYSSNANPDTGKLRLLDSHLLCGSVRPRDFATRESRAELQLHTSFYDNYKRGFKIMYTYERNPDHFKPNPAFVGLGCAGLLLFGIAGVFGALWFYRKRKTMNNHNDTNADLKGTNEADAYTTTKPPTPNCDEMANGTTYQTLTDDYN